MLPIIVEAAENFCKHQIRLPYERCELSSEKRTLLASIDIETPEGPHRAYVGCEAELIQLIAEIFLGEDESDEQTLNDMLLETANMIVGSAKVLAKEAYEQSFTIATPFLVPEEFAQIQPDAFQCIGVDGGAMLIALKRL